MAGWPTGSARDGRHHARRGRRRRGPVDGAGAAGIPLCHVCAAAVGGADGGAGGDRPGGGGGDDPGDARLFRGDPRAALRALRHRISGLYGGARLGEGERSRAIRRGARPPPFEICRHERGRRARDPTAHHVHGQRPEVPPRENVSRAICPVQDGLSAGLASCDVGRSTLRRRSAARFPIGLDRPHC